MVGRGFNRLFHYWDDGEEFKSALIEIEVVSSATIPTPV